MNIHNPPLNHELWELGFSRQSMSALHLLDCVARPFLGTESQYPSTKFALHRWQQTVEASKIVTACTIEPVLLVSDFVVAGI